MTTTNPTTQPVSEHRFRLAGSWLLATHSPDLNHRKMAAESQHIDTADGPHPLWVDNTRAMSEVKSGLAFIKYHRQTHTLWVYSYYPYPPQGVSIPWVGVFNPDNVSTWIAQSWGIVLDNSKTVTKSKE